MAVTMKDVRSLLASEEPRYDEGARLGAGAIPHLAVLVHDEDPLLASKAAYLASLIGTEGAADVVRAAAASSEPTVRVAAAAGAQNMGGEASSDVLASLAGDDDGGVRKTALRSQAGDIGVLATTGAAMSSDGMKAAPSLEAPEGPGPRAAMTLGRQAEPGGAAGEGGGSIDGTSDQSPASGRDLGSGDGGGSFDGMDDRGASFGREPGAGEGGGSIDGSYTSMAGGSSADSGDAEALGGDVAAGRALAGAGGGRY